MNGYSHINDFLGGGYAGLPFGGQMTPDELNNLSKALAVGSDRDPPGTFSPGDGFAFRVEDLDPLMRVSTFESDAIVLWKMLKKNAARNTVVEWNDVESYGEDGYDGFINDGALPEMMDSTIARKFEFVKFIGVQAGITHGSTLVQSADGNLIAGETERKTMKLLELVERASFYGDASLDPGQWNGFFTQMKNAVAAGAASELAIRDMRGAPINLREIEKGAGFTRAEPNYGRLTDVFWNPLVHSGLTGSLVSANRAAQGQGSTNGVIGAEFDQIATSTGKINAHPTAFINFGRRPAANGLGDAVRRPPAPTLSVAVTTPAASGSKFYGSDAGDYSYSIVARNRFGASVPLTIGATTVASGDKVTFGIQATPGNPTLYFEVFRSTRNGGTTTKQLIKRIPNPNSGFTTVTIDDLNEDLPGTTEIFAVQFEPKVLDFKQLAPFMKIALGQLDLVNRWVQVCYGTPVLYLPKKAFMWKNVGQVELAE